MDLHEARRQAVLLILSRPPYSGNHADFCRDTGIAPSYLSRMLKADGEKDRKRIGDDMAIKLEAALNLESGQIVSPVLSHHVAERAATYGAGQPGVNPSIPRNISAQFEPIVAPRLIDWEADLRNVGEVLPAAFRLRLIDDAMSPTAGAGTLVEFSSTRTPCFGDAVLVRDAKGEPHFRKMCQLPEGWEARPTNRAYATLHHRDHGLQVLAVFVGITRQGGWAEIEG